MELPTQLSIRVEPDQALRIHSKKVEPSHLKSQEMKVFLDALIDIMKQSEGIGIAAPQVGVPLRICIVSDNGKNHFFLVNPEITWQSKDTIALTEGCLSVPNVFGIVTRPKRIHVKGLNEKGEKVRIKAKDWLSRVIQHEIDHLDGVLFTDRADSIMRENGQKTKL